MIATEQKTSYGYTGFTPQARRIIRRVYGDSFVAFALCTAYSPAPAHQQARRRAVAPDAFGAAGAKRLRLALTRSPHVAPGALANEQYLVNLCH